MINIDPKVQRIIDWRESFVTLPDNHFFELIRMYLGEIHSPFNKQKLVEQLGAFLRKEENRKTIVNLISESDLMILSAIHFIPDVTQEKLSEFFAGSMKFASLYERLLNLEERLLIYRHLNKNTRKTIISLNPALEDELIPLISKKLLLPQPSLDKRNDRISPSITPEKIAAFVNFINSNPGLCKADGSLKKRDSEKIEQIFGESKETVQFFQYLMNAFINLSLVKEFSLGWEIDRARLEAFASLPEKIQYAYLCVSSAGRFSRTGLVKQGKLLLETASAIPANGFPRLSILRSAYLIFANGEKNAGGSQTGFGSSRFASMLARAQEAEEGENSPSGTDNASAIMDRLFDCALCFGLLNEYGIDEKGNSIFVKGSALIEAEKKSVSAAGDALPKVLNIDAGFNVMLFPGLGLKSLLPLMDFLDIKQFDTAAVFEITRKSVMHGFDTGFDSQKIYALIEQFSAYGIPDNLKVSIDDWSKSYSSASLYKGYILKVDDSSSVIVENNPAISKYISEKLAPGIFLLNVQSDEGAEALIKNSGLDFIGRIQTAKTEVTGPAFPVFEVNKMAGSVLLGSKPVVPAGSVISSLDDETEAGALPSTEEQRKAHFDNLRGLLDKMNCTPEQREGLLLRINKKIILTPQQLNADSVKLEQIEANGMDYQGKVHVAESAITQNMMLELEYEDKKTAGGITVIVGTPVSIEKNSFDALVRLIVEPEHEERNFSLGQARNVKRIRGSLFRS